ncbi:MAG TPA: carboxypeptidase-like regulatory domain-containing protein, partial [Pyrinomonadaceae bacterium]
LAAFGFVSEAFAQRPCPKAQSGTLAGQLKDCYGAGVSKAEVTIKGGKVKRKLKSDREGRFEACLPEGIYELTIVKHGFMRHLVIDVEVKTGAEASVKLIMNAGHASDNPRAVLQVRPCPQLQY